jgi:hypothetical protein
MPPLEFELKLVGARPAQRGIARPDKGQSEVAVFIYHLVVRDGEVMEELVTQLKMLSGLGVEASAYSGLQPPHPDYTKEPNVTADVSWPKTGASGRPPAG